MVTFISPIQSLHFSILIDGVKHFFHFTPKSGMYRQGVLYVSDKREVEALRKHYMYGDTFIEEATEFKELETEPTKVSAIFENVKRTQDANKILRGEPYNVPEENLKSKADALRIAKELNISFPNLK